MNCSVTGVRPNRLRSAGIRVFHAAALVLILAIVLPVRAADERAVKTRVAPVYPEIARRMRIGGTVRVQAAVDAQGKVIDAKAVSGNHMLGVAAEEAVRQWKFAPGAGESSVSVEIDFTVSP